MIDMLHVADRQTQQLTGKGAGHMLCGIRLSSVMYMAAAASQHLGQSKIHGAWSACCVQKMLHG